MKNNNYIFLAILFAFYSCSSRPKIETMKAAQDDGACNRMLDYHERLKELVGEESIKMSNNELFFFKLCSKNNYIYGYTNEDDETDSDFIAITEKDLSKEDKLPDDDLMEKMPRARFVEKVNEIAVSFRDKIKSHLDHKEEEELKIKQFKNFKCESGEKRYRTVVVKTEYGNTERIQAHVLIEDRKFPLNMSLKIDGIDLPKKSGERANYIEFPEEIFLSANGRGETSNKEQIISIKQILNQTKGLASEKGYYKLKGQINYSTESGCHTSDEINISIHENELKNYQSRLNYGEFYEKVHSSCLNESKLKKVQSLYSELNLCKIQACKSEFRSLINNEKKIAAKSGYVNKMNMRYAGEALHFYEEVEERYKSIQRKAQSSIGCGQNIKSSKVTLLGGYNSGIMCFVTAEIKDNQLTKCQKSILSSSNTVDFFPEVVNGLINFDGKVMNFSNSELAEMKKKDEAKVEGKVEDPDVQVEKEQEEENRREQMNWRIDGIYFENSQGVDSESE